MRLLLTDEEAAGALGVAVRTFHGLRSQPWMPKPIVLGPRLLRWHLGELEAAVALMPRQVEPGEMPAQLRRAKIEAMKTGGVPA